MLCFARASNLFHRRPLAACLALLTAACSDPAQRTPDVPPMLDCAYDVSRITHDGSALVFAMSTVTIDPGDSPYEAHTGFDLDGFASTDVDPGGCTHQDYFSTLDPGLNCAAVRDERCVEWSPRCNCSDSLMLFGTGARGQPNCFGSVDNQLPTVANTIQTVLNADVRMSLLDDVGHGRVVVLARVTGVDAFDEDPEVHVQLLNGFTATGTGCATPMLGGVYQVDRASLRAGGTTEADGAVDLTGSIHHGRLRADATDADAFAIAFPLSGLAFRFELRHPIVAADVGPDGAVRGNFGGWVDGDALATEFARVAPQYADAIRGVVGGLVDLRMGGICEDRTVTPSRLGAMSFGMGFELVRVAIDPGHPVIDAPTPGSCAAVGDGG